MTAPQRQWRRPSGDGVYFVRSADSMALSKIARDFAREISNHHWSDAPYRRDRAGHNRDSDTRAGDRVLNDQETDAVRTNVMWVTAQVLGYHDPNFNVYEFAEACGVDIRTRRGDLDGSIRAGVREQYGRYMRPGTWEFDLSSSPRRRATSTTPTPNASGSTGVTAGAAADLPAGR